VRQNDLEDQIAVAKDEMEAWYRIHAGYTGQLRGFTKAIDELRRVSGVAYAAREDERARALRVAAEILENSPPLKEISREIESAWDSYEKMRNEYQTLSGEDE